MRSEWHPIETAPKDGRRILVLADQDGEAVVGIAAWEDTSYETDELVSERGNERTYKRVLNADGYFCPEGDYHLPTHWMPLPEPPKPNEWES